MDLNIKNITAPEDAAKFIFASIVKHLELHRPVLFFVTGGSSVAVGVKVSEFLRNYSKKDLLRNLTISITDERYGEVGHKDSNWQQLLDKGFSVPEAKLIPILTGDSLENTTKKFNETLEHEFKLIKQNNGYKIGLFGIGKDGHTAGVLPESPATHSTDMVYSYNAKDFPRITITRKAIEKLDEAVVYLQGSDKKDVLDLLEKGVDIIKMPSQMLKKILLLTIFTNY
jgi:6-phosphogluconolactonase/glucosamine-6-phosphate isomerase/deaminase